MVIAERESAANRFDQKLEEHSLELRRGLPEVLQVNVGRVCNQTCHHCHVNAGPHRTERMSSDVAEACIELLDRVPSIHTLDITGGAPELVEAFRPLVVAGRERRKRVVDRCNLTILTEPGYRDLGEFLAANHVDVVASLPCYTEENVDKQRGDGVFGRSLRGLRLLNELGYGTEEGRNRKPVEPTGPLRLDLVYNPLGPSLPPAQEQLEADYRRILFDQFEIRFDNLITITNMTIGRFRSDLLHAGKLEKYVTLLEDSFNETTVDSVMCRSYLSVDHEGYLYDCDFNQMLGIPLGDERLHVSDLDPSRLRDLAIQTGDHCLGCTAGCGSSCGGSLT